MVTWKEFAAAEPDLADVGRSLMRSCGSSRSTFRWCRFAQPPANGWRSLWDQDSGPVALALSEVQTLRSVGLRFRRHLWRCRFRMSSAVKASREVRTGFVSLMTIDKHMANASEVAFELWIDRVMHTRWEHVLTPQMRSEHRKWHAPTGPNARSWPR